MVSWLRNRWGFPVACLMLDSSFGKDLTIRLLFGMDAFIVKTKKRKKHEENDGQKKLKSADEAEIDKGSYDGKDPAAELWPTSLSSENIKWRTLTGENLNCIHCILYQKKQADEIFKRCEEQIEYNSGHLARVQIFGKWHDIPRKQVAFGDPGLSYHFSGNTVPARPWPDFIKHIRDQITSLTGQTFNFVLVNRYKDGHDHMGEHRDDERELVRESPIASLSLGQHRDFVFKHAESRGKNAKRNIPPVSIELQHGCLLMMNHPTNTFWYHALPVRKKVPGIRINMTFRHFKLPSKAPGLTNA